MRVLWITNILFPEAESLLCGNGVLRSTGGWMLGAANALLKEEEDIQLYIASISPLVNTLTRIKGERIVYYILPYGHGNLKENKQYEPYWIEIKKEIQPDVVHIHGTEYSQGLAYINACGNQNVAISIQGLVSVYANYYLAGLSNRTILRHITLRDCLRGTIWQEQLRFRQRGKYEIKMLQSVNHIIGRTDWDKAHVWAINPHAAYHFNNETLRPIFYDSPIWEYGNCKKHSIFISQATYPIKSLHCLLQAMPLILRHYPDTTIRVAGRDITQTKTFRQKMSLSGYGSIIKHMVKKYRLQDHITFTGNLDEKGMRDEYLKANLFVLPSAIENSPNSLGEAQILGVPCIAAYSGGIDNMIPTADCGSKYRFEETEMLAKAICNTFEASASFDNSAIRSIAKNRHNATHNAQALIDIYNKIAQ